MKVVAAIGTSKLLGRLVKEVFTLLGVTLTPLTKLEPLTPNFDISRGVIWKISGKVLQKPVDNRLQASLEIPILLIALTFSVIKV